MKSNLTNFDHKALQDVDSNPGLALIAIHKGDMVRMQLVRILQARLVKAMIQLLKQGRISPLNAYRKLSKFRLLKPSDGLMSIRKSIDDSAKEMAPDYGKHKAFQFAISDMHQYYGFSRAETRKLYRENKVLLEVSPNRVMTAPRFTKELEPLYNKLSIRIDSKTLKHRVNELDKLAGEIGYY